MSRSRDTQRLREAKSVRFKRGTRLPPSAWFTLYGNGCPDCGSERCDWCESNHTMRNDRQAYEPVRDLLADALDPSCGCETCSWDCMGAGVCPECGEAIAPGEWLTHSGAWCTLPSVWLIPEEELHA